MECLIWRVFLKEADLRKTIEEIIGKANLDKVTMKTVVKDVHDKYPDSDLTGKKDFIKKVVKELLSSWGDLIEWDIYTACYTWKNEFDWKAPFFFVDDGINDM